MTYKDRKEYFKNYYKLNKKKMNKNGKISNMLGRKKMDNVKRSKGCKICNIKDPSVLQFHHRNPKTKLFSIGNAHQKKWIIILKEMKKCDILCSNCHLKMHWGKIK